MMRLASALAILGLVLACDDEDVSTNQGREQFCNTLVGTWQSETGNETWVIAQDTIVIETRPPEATAVVLSRYLNYTDDSYRLTVWVTQYVLEGAGEDNYSEQVTPPDGPYIKPYRLYDCKLTVRNPDSNQEHVYLKQ